MNYDGIPEIILQRMKILDISMKQMAAALGMSVRNFYRRLEDPGTFKLDELEIVCEELGLKLKRLIKS